MSPLYPPLNEFILTHTARLFPDGFDRLPESAAPSTWEEVARYLELNGRIGVSADHSDATIYGEPAVNHAFRAWHDWTHYLLGPNRGAFTAAGERAVLGTQQRETRAHWPRSSFGSLPCLSAWHSLHRERQLDQACRLLHAEVIGQLEHKEEHGDFPNDQRGFVQAYLTNPVDAVGSRW